jgi:hypothetical protein
MKAASLATENPLETGLLIFILTETGSSYNWFVKHKLLG